MPRRMVIGIGNELRGDDAVGLYAARLIADLARPDIHVLLLGDGLHRLLTAWRPDDQVLLVDAVCSNTHSAPPAGEIHIIDLLARDAPGRLPAHSTHAVDLGQITALAGALARLPARLFLFGIEGKQFELNAPMTPAVRAAADQVVDIILRYFDES